MRETLEVIMGDFMAHGHCFRWTPDILFAFIVGNILTALSYVIIPFLLFQFYKERKDIPFTALFKWFGLFIIFCGAGHIINTLNIWNGWYRFEAYWVVGTGIVSAITCYFLIRYWNDIINIPSPNQLREANEKLQIEIEQKDSIQVLLKRSNEELEQFAYIASHDLQAPLRTISSYIDLIQNQYSSGLDDKGKLYIKNAASGAERMHKMIESLLIYSKIDQKDRKFESVNIQEIIENAKQNLHAVIKEKQAIIEVPKNLPVIKGDESQLIQLFQNLIGNAIKFVANQTTPHIIISCKEKNNFVEFSIKDNGIGIEKKYTDKIFEIFQRLHGRSDYEGAGIGLATCKRIVDRHGGQIWLNSEVKQGAEFLFTLEK